MIRKKFVYAVITALLTIGSVQTSYAALVLHLDFENGLSDASGFGNDAVSVGSTAITSGGYLGNGLSLNSGLAWLEVADSDSLDISTEITMSAWVNYSGRIGNNAGIFFKGALVGQQPDWQMNLAGGGSNSALDRAGASINGTGFATVESAVRDADPFGQNVWRHIAATYDGSLLSLYLDGVLVETDMHAAPLRQTNSALYIGNRFRPAGDVGGFQGFLDELRIYDNALNASEILALTQPPSPPPVGVSEPGSLAIIALGILALLRTRAFSQSV